jgi:hypothetical protein
MMGIGQVVTLKLPAERLRAVNLAIEQNAWGRSRPSSTRLTTSARSGKESENAWQRRAAERDRVDHLQAVAGRCHGWLSRLLARRAEFTVRVRGVVRVCA